MLASHAGSGCALTTEDMAIRVSLHSSLNQSLVDVINLDDVNEDSIISWANSLTSLAISGDELFAADATLVVHDRIANLTITHTPSRWVVRTTLALSVVVSVDCRLTAGDSSSGAFCLMSTTIRSCVPHKNIILCKLRDDNILLEAC